MMCNKEKHQIIMFEDILLIKLQKNVFNYY